MRDPGDNFAAILKSPHFRAQNKWQASGKAILKYLKQHDYDFAENYRDAFDDLFKYGHVQKLEVLVQQILEPYGGLLWDGYRSDAPKEWKLTSTLMMDAE